MQLMEYINNNYNYNTVMIIMSNIIWPLSTKNKQASVSAIIIIIIIIIISKNQFNLEEGR